jgi:AcrR family transcriptional regulator
VATTEGLRERKKEATRLALHHAALRLAMAHGLDNLTVEAIAEAADVSRRTFSNHFGSKEEALVYADTVRLAQLVDRVRARPDREPVWDVLTRAALDLLPEVYDDDSQDDEWQQRRRVLMHPDLARYWAAAYSTMERELAAELARRFTGPDTALRSRVVAATFLATVRTALHYWNDNPDRSRHDAVAAALAAAAPAGTAPRRTPTRRRAELASRPRR